MSLYVGVHLFMGIKSEHVAIVCTIILWKDLPFVVNN